MLEVVQAGQFGKTDLLFDMHRLRKRVFKDRMGWDVAISASGLETDQFDIPEAVYLLALDSNRRVIGNWRLLPCAGPIMIREIWPQFLGTIGIPMDEYVWEASRFAIDPIDGGQDEGLAQIHIATQELFCGLTELCLLCGIREVYTMYDMRIARLLRRLDCPPRTVSARFRIGDHLSEVGAFATDEIMLKRLRKASGIANDLINSADLPPSLRAYCQRKATFYQGVHDYEAAE